MTLIDKAEALAPCPFCGGKAVAFSYITEGAVRCSDCYAAITRGHKHTSETGYDEAIAAWNRRPALPDIDTFVLENSND